MSEPMSDTVLDTETETVPLNKLDSCSITSSSNDKLCDPVIDPRSDSKNTKR